MLLLPLLCYLPCVEVRELQTAFQYMIKFNQEVIVALQRQQGVTSLQVHEIFDHVLETS